MAFSDGDMAGRDWLRQRIADSGLAFYQDGAANIFARLNWKDDVPNMAMWNGVACHVCQ